MNHALAYEGPLSSNLFEQQAQMELKARAKLTKLDIATLLVAEFDLEDCRELVNAIADHVAKLEGVAFGLEDVSLKMAEAIAEHECEEDAQDTLRAHLTESGRG